jgi:hypothetical protein
MELVKEILTLKGFTVHTAVDGEDSIRKIGYLDTKYGI